MPDSLFAILALCWQPSRPNRPTFTDLLRRLPQVSVELRAMSGGSIPHADEYINAEDYDQVEPTDTYDQLAPEELYEQPDAHPSIRDYVEPGVPADYQGRGASADYVVPGVPADYSASASAEC